MELEPSTGFTPTRDPRRHMDEPLPVRLIAVADVTLPCTDSDLPALDAFYADLLGFERYHTTESIVYRADNFRLRFEPQDGPVHRPDYRPVLIEVQSLKETEQKLIDRELEYARQHGLFVGQLKLALTDPAGNPVELTETRPLP